MVDAFSFLLKRGICRCRRRENGFDVCRLKPNGHMLLMHNEHIRLRDVHCTEEAQQKWGDEQYKWINETVKLWDNDPNMLWRAVVLHHPMWGKWYPDFAPIVLNFLPILQEHKFDLYLCGHEHVVSYANYPYS